MAPPTLVLSAVVTLPLAAMYLLVAARIHERSRRESQPALSWFAAFWAGIGVYGAAECAWTFAHLAAYGGMPFALFVLHLKIVGMVVAFAGLVLYALVILGAPRRALALVVAAYAILLVVLETYYSWRDPVGEAPGAWGMRLVYSVNDTQPWWTLVVGLLFGPPLVSTILYASMLRHTSDPLLRFRIALVTASLLAFFLPVFVSWRAGGFPWWGAVEKTLSALMAAGILVALWPPPTLRARVIEGALRRERARDALAARVRELM